MKKIVAMLLALAMLLAMTSAMAENHGKKTSSAFEPETALNAEQELKIVKGWAINDADDTTNKHPADRVTFTVSGSKYYFNGLEDTSVTPPALTAPAVVDVTESTDKANIIVKLPDFTGCKVGEYVYYLTEADYKTAGVTYNYTTENPLTLKVTLINETDATTGELTGNVIIGGIALRDGGADGDNPGNKTEGNKLDSTTGSKDDVHNEYEYGKITVDKTVTGNMGDTTKPWIFKLTLTPAAGETVRGTVNISGNGTYIGEPETAPTADDNGNVTGNTAASSLTIAPTWDSAKVVYFTLTSGQSLSFDNIPEGVTYTIEEVEANKYDYTTTKPTESGTIAKNDDITASYVNDKSQNPDTGVSVTVVPYIMILAVAMMGAAMMITRRRKEEV
jgi:hypothetical protein